MARWGKWWQIDENWFLNIKLSAACGNITARLYSLTCLLAYLSNEGSVTTHVRHVLFMARWRKWERIVKNWFLNINLSAAGANITARLYSLTCLLADLSTKGSVTTHVRHVVFMARWREWWRIVENWFLNIKLSAACTNIAAQLYSLTCLLAYLSNEGSVTTRVRHVVSMARWRKWWRMDEAWFLNITLCAACANIAAWLYSLTCLLAYLSSEGSVTTHVRHMMSWRGDANDDGVMRIAPLNIKWSAECANIAAGFTH